MAGVGYDAILIKVRRLFPGEDVVFAGGEGGRQFCRDATEIICGEGGGSGCLVGVDDVGGCVAEVGEHEHVGAVDGAGEDVEVGRRGGIAVHFAPLHAGLKHFLVVLEVVELLIECEVFVAGLESGRHVLDEELKGAVHAGFLAGVDEWHAGEGVGDYGESVCEIAQALELGAFP